MNARHLLSFLFFSIFLQFSGFSSAKEPLTIATLSATLPGERVNESHPVRDLRTWDISLVSMGIKPNTNKEQMTFAPTATGCLMMSHKINQGKARQLHLDQLTSMLEKYEQRKKETGVSIPNFQNQINDEINQIKLYKYYLKCSQPSVDLTLLESLTGSTVEEINRRLRHMNREY